MPLFGDDESAMSSLLIPRNPIFRLWAVLRRIQMTLGLPDSDFAGVLELREREFERLGAHRAEPPLRSLEALSHRLNVSLDAILDGDIDYRVLRARFLGRPQELPEKYLIGAASRRRTVVNVLDFVEREFGWISRTRILRRFQVDEAALLAEDSLINARLSTEICAWLGSWWDAPDVFRRMGMNSLRLNRKGPFGVELAAARDVHELFEMCFPDLIARHIENNFNWRLRARNTDRIVVRGAPNPAAYQLTAGKLILRSQICQVRQGYIASLPLYLNLPAARVRKISCVYAGDSGCDYDVEFHASHRSAALP